MNFMPKTIFLSLVCIESIGSRLYRAWWFKLIKFYQKLYLSILLFNFFLFTKWNVWFIRKRIQLNNKYIVLLSVLVKNFAVVKEIWQIQRKIKKFSQFFLKKSTSNTWDIMFTPKFNYKLWLIVSLFLFVFGVGFGFIAFPGILRDIIKSVRFFCLHFFLCMFCILKSF